MRVLALKQCCKQKEKFQHRPGLSGLQRMKICYFATPLVIKVSLDRTLLPDTKCVPFLCKLTQWVRHINSENSRNIWGAGGLGSRRGAGRTANPSGFTDYTSSPLETPPQHTNTVVMRARRPPPERWTKLCGHLVCARPECLFILKRERMQIHACVFCGCDTQFATLSVISAQVYTLLSSVFMRGRRSNYKSSSICMNEHSVSALIFDA